MRTEPYDYDSKLSCDWGRELMYTWYHKIGQQYSLWRLEAV